MVQIRFAGIHIYRRMKYIAEMNFEESDFVIFVLVIVVQENDSSSITNFLQNLKIPYDFPGKVDPTMVKMASSGRSSRRNILRTNPILWDPYMSE